MAAAGAVNPNYLARQSREKVVLQAEENYKNDLNTAAKSKETAINNATTMKAEAVKQAQAKLDLPKKRLSEARDRIEAGLRKQELNETRRLQEQMLILAEDTRIKALKQAEELGKRLAIQAVDTRRRAIQQAYANEKKMKLEAEQASKTQRENVRSKVKYESKAEQREAQEVTEAKTRARKAAAAEHSTLEALEKTRGKAKIEKPQRVNDIKAPEEFKHITMPLINSEVSKRPSEAVKSGKVVPSVSRTGMIKLIIACKDTNLSHMVDFENSLRKIPDIHIVMVGGTNKEGIQMTVSIEKSVALSDALRQLPMIEEIIDRHVDILVKLKPVIIFESQM